MTVLSDQPHEQPMTALSIVLSHHTTSFQREWILIMKILGSSFRGWTRASLPSGPFLVPAWLTEMEEQTGALREEFLPHPEAGSHSVSLCYCRMKNRSWDSPICEFLGGKKTKKICFPLTICGLHPVLCFPHRMGTPQVSASCWTLPEVIDSIQPL